MELDSVFEFISPQAIKIKGTRVGIEIVIDEFLSGASPEEILLRYSSLVIRTDLCENNLCDGYLLPTQQRADGCLRQSRAQTGGSRL
jgi:hypothetical protein